MTHDGDHDDRYYYNFDQFVNLLITQSLQDGIRLRVPGSGLSTSMPKLYLNSNWVVHESSATSLLTMTERWALLSVTVVTCFRFQMHSSSETEKISKYMDDLQIILKKVKDFSQTSEDLFASQKLCLFSSLWKSKVFGFKPRK